MSDDKNFKHRVKTKGEYDVTDNALPSSSGLIAHDRGAVIDETSQNQRPTAVDGENDKVALDVAISHTNGDDITEENPLPMYQTESPGDEVDEYDNAVDVAEDATVYHTYTVSAAKTLKAIEAEDSSTGFAILQLQVETGVGAGTYNTVMTKPNSVSNPSVEFKYVKRVATGIIVRVCKTNCDEDDTDLHSQIRGIEV